jgi:hypothetical protein
MNKIIVRIAEGLGNQLFMYANSFALSKKTKYDLFIDDESAYFKTKDIRNYQLNNFNISTSLCDKRYKFNTYLKNIKRKILIKSDFFKKKKRFIIEKKNYLKQTSYIEHDVSCLSDLVFVEGHYESEKYFIDYKNLFKNQFSFNNEYLYKNNKYLPLINSERNIVSICVRQHRFSERVINKFDQNEKINSENFTKKTINYINRAVNFIDTKLDNVNYLVWSNDFSNLRSYLPENKFTFIDNKENKSLTDFYLLLKCKNFIVGPTSFHWWPAWLNNNNDSLILRPKDINISKNADFWPDDWISV